MSKTFSFILLIAVLFSLCACAGEDPTVFYYPRKDPENYVYGAADAIIAAEERDVSDGADLTYLLKLYLEGPLSPELKSPFPKGTGLTNITVTEGQLEIKLSEEFAQLEGINHTIACACIASTCFALTDAEEIIISTSAQGNETVTSLFRDSIILLDDTSATVPPQ